MDKPKKIIIVGAGIGGIATSIFLARQGFQVTVLEKNKTPGGRCGQVIREGHRFDLGATILFLPSTYREVFKKMGLNLEDCFEFTHLDILYKLYYDDDSVLDITLDEKRMTQQLEALEKGSFRKMERYVAKGYEFLRIGLGTLLNRNFYHPFQFFTINNILQVLRIKAHLKHSAYIRRFFRHPHLRMAFTFQNIYVEQSPYQASALFSMLPAAEMVEGSMFPKGGMHRVAEKLVEVARDQGVEFLFDQPVQKIDIENNMATGITTESGTRMQADLVVANADLPYVYKTMLPDKRIARRINRMEYTCSAMMFHWGMDQRYPELSHHNVFLVDDYRDVLRTIFKKHNLSERPCFYVHAPVPHEGVLSAEEHKQIRKIAREGVIRRLEKFGLTDFEQHIKFEICYQPGTWESVFHVSKGATFGSLSHKILQMGYFRPHNRHRKYRNLYFTGGSTHPGNGIPLVLLSSKLTSERILKDMRKL